MKSEDFKFRDLGIESRFVEMLNSRFITTPTTIQRCAIPAILKGEDVVAKSQTGSGKSLAYLLPLLQMLTSDKAIEQSEQLLIIIPTRELAQQIAEECKLLSALSLAVIYGGVEYAVQIEMFKTSPQIVIATPGRLIDLMERGVAKLDRVKYFVLDEVDQMVDMGFRDTIMELATLRGESTQTLCFSATLPSGVEQTLKEIVGGYCLIEDQSQPLAAQSIMQSGYYVEQSLMDQLLLHLIRTKQPSRAIVFCRSRKMADRLNKILLDASISSEVMHSERSQVAREYILGRFKSGETSILVATDLIARGVDVDGVSHVFNFGLPQNTEQYIHRIGRTGRAGCAGEAISLICPDEAELLGATCALMRQAIPMSTSHPYATPAITIALNGVKRGKKSRR